MLRQVIAALSLLALVSCKTTPATGVGAQPEAVYHPRLPRPVEVCSLNWEVLVVNNEPFVALTYNDNITAAICDDRKTQYIEELLQVVCSYRKPLNEKICSRYNMDKND